MFSPFTSCCGYREADEESKIDKRHRKQYKRTIKKRDHAEAKETQGEDIENQIRAIPERTDPNV